MTLAASRLVRHGANPPRRPQPHAWQDRSAPTPQYRLMLVLLTQPSCVVPRQPVFRNFEAAAVVFALRTFAALWRVTGVIPNSDANLTIRSNATFDIEIQGL
jgi:hypothetical protein